MVLTPCSNAVARYCTAPRCGIPQPIPDFPLFVVTGASGTPGATPHTPTGRRIYYERVHCLLALASFAKQTDPESLRLDEPPANAERPLGRVLGQAFHQGCSLGHRARDRAPARAGHRDR